MADTLREVAQEAVAKTERSTFDYRTAHGKQVAGALRAEADKDVFTTLQIAAGEQVSPAILRANLEVSIGILKADGTIDHTGTGYQGRYDRAVHAINRAEKYFDDQADFRDFLASTEGQAVVESTGKFLLTHPALTEYFANITNMGQRENAAKFLAEKYLQDPYAREKVKAALLESALNKGDVADEFSEVARKRDALEAKLTDLRAKQVKLEGSAGPPVVLGEIDKLKTTRREFDRFSDDARTVAGTEFTALQTKRGELAVLDSDIRSIDGEVTAARTAIQALRAEMTNLQQGRRIATFAPTRDEAQVLADITAKEGEITTKLTEKQTKEVEKAAKQADIDAIEAEKKQLDADVKKREDELKEIKDALTATKNEKDEQVLKLKKMEAAKGRSEELAVSELENIFKKGVEQELMERLERARDAADQALEKSAAKAKDIDEKQYRELRAKRHKKDDGSIDGRAIKEDFSGMMRTSTEYYIVKNTDNSVHISAKKPDGTWESIDGSPAVPGTIAAGSTFYLTGPEFAMLRMMNKTNEFGTDFMLGKLKDPEWMKQESEDFAIQTLRDKMYASRGWLTSKRTGVKRLSSAEIVKIKNSSWGTNMLEQALEANKAQVAEIDKALGGELLKGPGSWREKIGKMSNKKLALLIAVLATGGALLLPQVTLTGLMATGAALNQIPGAAVVGAGAGAATGLAIGHSGRSRTS